MTHEPLSEHDRAVLAFEALSWQRPGSKEAALLERFGITPTEHYRRLNQLIDQPAALEHAPVIVGRLRRLRADRARARHHLTSTGAAR